MAAYSGEQCEIKRVSLMDYPISSDVLYLIPERIVKKFQVLPLVQSGNNLTMAVAKPVDLRVLKMIRRATQLRVHPLFCARKEITEAIQYFYSPTQLQRTGKKIQIAPANSAAKSVSANVHQAVEQWFVQLLNHAIEKKCTQIIFESTVTHSKIYLKLLDRQEELELPAGLSGKAIVQYLKLLADRSDSGQSFWEQQVRLDFDTAPVSVYFAGICSAENSIATLKIHCFGEINTLKKLGLVQEQIQLLDQILMRKNGVLFISARSEGGKTTTLNALANYLSEKQRRVIQLSQSIEIPNDRVVQIALQTWNSIDSVKFWSLIKQQKPCVLLIDDFYSRDVLKSVLELASEDILVIFSLPFQDSQSVSHFLQSQKINLIAQQHYYLIRQLLVHQLCAHCKEIVAPDSENPFEPVFRKGNGCPDCHNTGFQGISGIFEINTLNQKLLFAQPDPDYFTRIINGQPTLFEAGLQKVEKGEIEFEAIMQLR